MNFEPINVTELAGTIFGMALVMIPVLGVTLRFAIKPLLESYARAFPNQSQMQVELERLGRRVQELEDALGRQPALEQGRERLALAPTTSDVAALPR